VAGLLIGMAIVRLACGAVLVGQLTGDALAQGVEMAHQLGQGTGSPHGRTLGAGGRKQAENLKLLGVV
jgi:hypothetical protein